MDSGIFDLAGIDISWCPGCGDFKILDSIKNALRELELTPHDVVMVSGIGQAAKTPHYMRSHFFNGLHGRALSNATAIKAANKSLKIIAIGGDGDMYGEGGNHFTHTIRRNPDITNLVFNNMVYGLTKGQASPTSPVGFRTSVQVDGVQSRPFNPLAASLVNGATFVARAFAGDGEQTKEIIKRAILHKGVFPCRYFPALRLVQQRQYLQVVPGEHLHGGGARRGGFSCKALELALVEEGPFPLGVLYRREGVPVFEDTLAAYRNDDRPLFRREAPRKAVKELIDSMCC